MMNRISGIDQQSTIVKESKEATRKRAFDILVLQELAIQEAMRQGLHIEDAFIDRTMEQFISKLGHEEGYQEYLAKNHITTVEFRAQVERSLMIQRILTEEVIKKTRVTNEDIEKEYERTKDDHRVPEKVTVVDIAVLLDQGEQAAKKRFRSFWPRSTPIMTKTRHTWPATQRLAFALSSSIRKRNRRCMKPPDHSRSANFPIRSLALMLCIY
jgi:hypothetical protein